MGKSISSRARQSFLHLLAGSVNAFFDVLLKNGIVAYAAFKTDFSTGLVGWIATLAWSLFVLPFFLFSAHGGYLGDRYNKRATALMLRTADLVIALAAALGFQQGSVGLLLAAVFAKGATSALYGPLKYAMLSEFLPLSALTTATALLEGGTMAAILAGTYAGAKLATAVDPAFIGLAALGAAGIAWCATWAGPSGRQGNPSVAALGWNPLLPTVGILRLAWQDRRCLAAILGLSWYWALGAVYLSATPLLVRMDLQGDEDLVASILLVFTFGVGLGLALGSCWLRGKPRQAVANTMAWCIGLAGLDLYFFIGDSLLRTQLDLFAIAFASGLYATHFSSVLHLTVADTTKARIYAAYNIVSSLLTVAVLALSAMISEWGVPLPMNLALFACATPPLALLVNAAIKRCA